MIDLPPPPVLFSSPPALVASASLFDEARPPRLLLVSSWQDINIGDIAHTPGALALLERYLPQAEVTVWLFNRPADAVLDLIQRRFPHVSFIEGRPDAQGQITDPTVLAAMDQADFLLHGSGPSTLGWAHAEAFQRRTGRGFGVYGTTYGLYGIPERATLSRADFVYFRDPVSLERARAEGVKAPIMGVAPDVAFATDVTDDARAEAFLREHRLEPGRFLVCISRYRHTPMWEIPRKQSAFDAARQARNDERKEADHAPLLEAIVSVVRETGLKVLLAPEDETQISLTREMLYDRLPADVRPHVVWRETFWLPDEALSVYRRSAGIFGHEMHSPIMSIGHGIPAIVCRWAEQSSKGEMWREFGLGDWLFDLDDPAQAARVVPAVLALARDPAAARAKAAAGQAAVRARFDETMPTVIAALARNYEKRRIVPAR